jgi:hypothetical protein
MWIEKTAHENSHRNEDFIGNWTFILHSETCQYFIHTLRIGNGDSLSLQGIKFHV